MKYTIKDNNGNLICSVESNNSVNDEVSLESINRDIASIIDRSNELNKSIEMYSIISDTRAMESLGYKSVEESTAVALRYNNYDFNNGAKEKTSSGIKKFGEKIWNGLKAFGRKIVELINKCIDFLKRMIYKIKVTLNLPKAVYGAMKIVDNMFNAGRDDVAYNLSENAPVSIIQIANLLSSDKAKEFAMHYENFKNISKLDLTNDSILKDLYDHIQNPKDPKFYNKFRNNTFKNDFKDTIENLITDPKKISTKIKDKNILDFFQEIAKQTFKDNLESANEKINQLEKYRKLIQIVFDDKKTESDDNAEKLDPELLRLISDEFKLIPKAINTLTSFIGLSSQMYELAAKVGVEYMEYEKKLKEKLKNKRK